MLSLGPVPSGNRGLRNCWPQGRHPEVFQSGATQKKTMPPTYNIYILLLYIHMSIYGFHSTHNFCSGHLVVLVFPLFSSLVPRNQGPDRGATYFSRTWWSKAISVKRLRSMIFGTWGVLVVMVAVVGLLRPYLQYMYNIYIYIIILLLYYICVCECVICMCMCMCMYMRTCMYKYIL